MMLIKVHGSDYDLTDYKNYLREIRTQLPHNTREFAFFPGHYDIDNDRCLYDSWVESANFKEVSSGDRGQIRHLELTVKLLGPAHDGFHEIVYVDVQKYDCKLDRVKHKSAPIGHGDWMVDEILLDSSGFVSHEIEFSDSGRWKILCADIVYQWIPKPI